MRTRDKILLTILLAVVVWCLFGCGRSEHSELKGDVTVAYLQQLYGEYNNAYFQNRLPHNLKIDMDEKQSMASTTCDDFKSCTLKFNLKFVAAPRVAQFIMLHEMCHIKTWDTDTNHGKVWRTCMVQLDLQGAFREIIIDNYAEGM